MGVKKFKPFTSARRGMTGFDFSELTKVTPEKSLTVSLRKKGARNNRGRVTMRSRGGGHKRRYRLVDFKRVRDNIPAVVKAIEYDPNRSCRIALICYQDGEKSYIIAPVDLKVGASILSGEKADIRVGHCKKLKDIPIGTIIHNIELKPGKGGQLARGAGSAVTLAAKLGNYCQIKLPSGEVRQVLSECRASIGQVGNTEHENLNWGKAGRTRWLGFRGKVRGMCKKPSGSPWWRRRRP